jgi:uracil phosphoribosyltransferase
MPDFWQVSTVSMGLGPIMAIYQARFMKYLHHRGLADTAGRKVWAFLGDGEMDEPESQGAIALAVREKLDNLVFVINCNLQRLDGPVRGNSKIVQELEGNFRGAGWNVIKVLWGGGWDELLAKDHKGLLRKRMEECIDGEYQNFKAKGGGYIREQFFGKYPELKEMVAHLSDDEIYYGLIRAGIVPSQVCFELLTALLTTENVRLDHLTMARMSDADGNVTGVDLSGSKIGGPVDGAVLILPDPMGATGKTTERVLRHYHESFGRPSKVIALPMIATPEYLRAVLEFDDLVVYTARLDRGMSDPDVLGTVPGAHWDRERGLDEKSYIVPGAGGMGEVINNSWC